VSAPYQGPGRVAVPPWSRRWPRPRSRVPDVPRARRTPGRSAADRRDSGSAKAGPDERDRRPADGAAAPPRADEPRVRVRVPRALRHTRGTDYTSSSGSAASPGRRDI
jgi:hypothetical protein